MRQKNGVPADTGTPTGGVAFERRRKLIETLAEIRKKRKEILLFSDRGFIVKNPGNVSTHQRTPGKRGTIVKWSAASRRRMRRFMLERRPPKAWSVVGATFTIPGPVMDKGKTDVLWNDWATRAAHMGLCAVWRVEVQQRGARHWHVIVGIPPACDMTSAGYRLRMPADACAAIADTWHGALDRLGEQKFKERYNTKKQVYKYGEDSREADECGWWEVSSLMNLPGALDHSVKVESNGDSGSWMRYLQDHASKHKQEQETGSGRHWGVIGRKHFEKLTPETLDHLNDAEFARVVRWLQRMATPSFPAMCVFGRRLGRKCRRGSWGESVWFSRVDTVRRMAEYVQKRCP